MNTKTLTAQTRQVRDEVERIVDAWPTASVRYTLDHLAAVLIIRNPNSTYIIEVEPGDFEAKTRSLWVSHVSPIVEGYVPDWTEGWVD